MNWDGNSFQPEVGRLLSRSLGADVFAAERASGRWTAAAAAGVGVVGPGCCPLTLVALVHAFTPSRRSRCSAAQRLLDATLCGWCVHRALTLNKPIFHGATGTPQAASAQGVHLEFGVGTGKETSRAAQSNRLSTVCPLPVFPCHRRLTGDLVCVFCVLRLHSALHSARSE